MDSNTQILGGCDITYSVLLVNYNMAPLIEQVIQNITEQIPRRCRYEIIIADNSTDANYSITQSPMLRDHPIRILQIKNNGFVDALNRMIPLSRGEFVMIAHPDIEILDNGLIALARFLKNNIQAGAVSPNLKYLDGSECKIRLRLPKIKTELKRLANTIVAIVSSRRPLQDDVLWDRCSDIDAETLMSVCILFRGAVLRDVAMVNPKVKSYYANDCICHRLGELGYSCHYILGATVIHFERHTPAHAYADRREMAYKRNVYIAQPRIRSDYFAFLAGAYSLRKRIVLRLCALCEDVLMWICRWKRPRAQWLEIRSLTQAIWVDVGGA